MMGASCHTKIIEDSSAGALESGQATMLLGSNCLRPMALGYDSCPIRKGQAVPELRLYFMNPAEYSVSDCHLGVFKTGTMNEAGEAVIDLSGLSDQVHKSGFCLLRIEAIERYVDPRDGMQKRQIPFAGGFFIEVLEPDYFPDPSDEVVSWCFKVSGTNKGRRKIVSCK